MWIISARCKSATTGVHLMCCVKGTAVSVELELKLSATLHACILTSLFVFWITSHIVCYATLFCTGTKWCILGNGKEDQVLLHVGLSWKAVQQCTYVLSVKQPQVRHHLLTHVLHVTVTSLCALPQTRPHNINKQPDTTLFYTHTPSHNKGWMK